MQIKKKKIVVRYWKNVEIFLEIWLKSRENTERKKNIVAIGLAKPEAVTDTSGRI